MNLRVSAAILFLTAVASPVSAGRPEGRDDATFVHDAMICMGTYQYLLDGGTDNISNGARESNDFTLGPGWYVSTILKQGAAEDVYRELGGKTQEEVDADTVQAEAAIRYLVEQDPTNLETYVSGCDGEFGPEDEE